MNNRICPHCHTPNLERVKRTGFAKNLPDFMAVKSYKCRNHACRWEGTAVGGVIVAKQLFVTLNSTLIVGLPVFTAVMLASMLQVESGVTKSPASEQRWEPTDLKSGAVQSLIKNP